eukprot:12873663-Ditylum_brightwellii.AAC.1
MHAQGETRAYFYMHTRTCPSTLQACTGSSRALARRPCKLPMGAPPLLLRAPPPPLPAPARPER